MLRQRTTKGKQIRFPGICEFARQMHVGREHVYRVLVGERRSPRLEKAARKRWPLSSKES